MATVTVVNSGFCNLDSVCRALAICGGSSVVTQDPDKVVAAERILLPGVGSFAAAVEYLNRSGLADAIRQAAKRGTPVFGICLGMQLLANTSEEGNESVGLGLIPGDVKRLVPVEPGERIPHVGWNTVVPVVESKLLGQCAGADFYFVHSYHFVCRDPRNEWARTPYCGSMTSVVGYENVMGTQFHPEKSMKSGLAILENFVRL